MMCIHCGEEINTHQRCSLTCGECGRPMDSSVKIIAVLQEYELIEEHLKVLQWGSMHYFGRLVPDWKWEDQPVFVDADGNVYTIGGVRCAS